MKIVNIIGGLGNQMFQYALAVSLKHRYPNEEVLIDTSHFHYVFSKSWKGTNLHNGYEIDAVFPHANIKKATPLQLMKVSWYMPNYILSRMVRRFLPVRKTEFIQKRENIFVYQSDALNREGDCYYEGNWESANYFADCREKIQEVFCHGTPNDVNNEYIKCMENENSVGIHVRRGDYLASAKWSGICDEKYYHKGIETIVSDGEQHVFYVFSNDFDWCKQRIVPLLTNHRVVIVNENKGKESCWDMFLMTHCKDLIIANSSFSWWGAFLNNRGGRIIAPNKWLNEDRKVEIWLNEWIKL